MKRNPKVEIYGFDSEADFLAACAKHDADHANQSNPFLDEIAAKEAATETKRRRRTISIRRNTSGKLIELQDSETESGFFVTVGWSEEYRFETYRAALDYFFKRNGGTI